MHLVKRFFPFIMSNHENVRKRSFNYAGSSMKNKHSTIQHYPKDAGKYIVWMDMEMTGLDIETDQILEITGLITDAQLNILAVGPDIVIHQPDSILDSMGAWCKAQHGESGLTEASRNSKVSLLEAEKKMLEFLSAYVPEKICPLGGNSVYMDKMFLKKYMPKLDSYLHYRIIDVSSIKELARRWYPKEFSNMPQKAFKHRTLDDIMDTVNELKYYKSSIFIKDRE